MCCAPCWSLAGALLPLSCGPLVAQVWGAADGGATGCRAASWTWARSWGSSPKREPGTAMEKPSKDQGQQKLGCLAEAPSSHDGRFFAVAVSSWRLSACPGRRDGAGDSPVNSCDTWLCRIGQGREKVIAFLRENDDIRQTIENVSSLSPAGDLARSSLLCLHGASLHGLNLWGPKLLINAASRCHKGLLKVESFACRHRF